MPKHRRGSAPLAEDRQVNTVGIFAGRGDVILSMALALLFGCWAGWQVRGIWESLKARKSRKATLEE